LIPSSPVIRIYLEDNLSALLIRLFKEFPSYPISTQIPFSLSLSAITRPSFSAGAPVDAHDEETYNRICRPAFKNAYSEVLSFIKEAKKFIPEVRVTVVTVEGVDVEKCRKIAEDLGVGFRVRELDVIG
jgi:hypothetical protein